MTEARSCAIGLDVGGTKIAAGLVMAESGAMRHRRIVATDAQRGGKAVFDTCRALIDELLAAA
ncbi:MAG: hypothetical protein HC802_06895 [Caldilineaceae bacterium]|nr:hypothetical protein [Caldilineaceae bacterium]